MTKGDFIAQYVLARVPTVAEQKYVTRDIVKEAIDYWAWIVIACICDDADDVDTYAPED